MIYRAIGIMSGSSLDGLDLVFAEFNEQGGTWSYEIRAAACYEYEPAWKERLRDAVSLGALDYQLLHTDYGHYLGNAVNRFITENNLQFQAGLIASHGHTSFHVPARKMTAQLGDGAAIAAVTGLPVVSDLRAMDLALGGQGAPIVPVGERFLLPGYDYFLNIGGIANLSVSGDGEEPGKAFDCCPANRVLNLLANEAGLDYDGDGKLASEGSLSDELLNQLNALDYYRLPPPKSLANDFGTGIVYPLIQAAGISIPDALRTCCEHIAVQISGAVSLSGLPVKPGSRMLATGGGALNRFLVSRLATSLADKGINLVLPDEQLISYKEALIMAFIGVLRWRQEFNLLASVTGASRNSIGGALWAGQDG